jgi:long-chain fatty acid transport protein
MPSTRFSNGASVLGTASNPAFSGNGGDAGGLSLVPGGYFTMDLAPRWKMGLGVNVPFGLSTKYDPTWIGRFQGIESEVKTLNINPSVSWAASERLSLGFGLNWQRGQIDLLTGANYAGAWGGAVAGALAAGQITGAQAAALAGLVGANAEGQVRTSVDGDAWGYNFGLMLDLNSATRLGVAYRSSVKYNLSGTTSFTSRPAGPALGGALGAAFNNAVADGNVGLALKTPDTLSTSVVHTLNTRWQLLGDLTWTGWSKIKTLPLTRDTGSTLDTLTFNFKDTLRASVGANYQYSDAWTLKIGYAFDQSPVPNAESRSVRLPDNDRNWLALGAKYRLNRASAVDFGYARLQVKDAPINNNQNPPTNVKGLINGNYKASVDILSVQYAYLF